MYGIDTYAIISKEASVSRNLYFMRGILTGHLQQASSTFERPSRTARGRACRIACRHPRWLTAHSSHKYYLDYGDTRSRISSPVLDRGVYLSDRSKVELDMTEGSALFPILPHIQVVLCHDFSISTSLKTSYCWHSPTWDVDCHEMRLDEECGEMSALGIMPLTKSGGTALRIVSDIETKGHKLTIEEC